MYTKVINRPQLMLMNYYNNFESSILKTMSKCYTYLQLGDF